jgi:hypothetical protein
VYVDHGISGLDVFRVTVTGVLEPIQAIGFGSDIDNNPVGVCVSPNGEFVYEGNANGIVDPGPMTLRVESGFLRPGYPLQQVMPPCHQ